MFISKGEKMCLFDNSIYHTQDIEKLEKRIADLEDKIKGQQTITFKPNIKEVTQNPHDALSDIQITLYSEQNLRPTKF